MVLEVKFVGFVGFMAIIVRPVRKDRISHVNRPNQMMFGSSLSSLLHAYAPTAHPSFAQSTPCSLVSFLVGFVVDYWLLVEL